MTQGITFMAILIAIIGGGVAIGLTIAGVCNIIYNKVAKKGNK